MYSVELRKNGSVNILGFSELSFVNSEEQSTATVSVWIVTEATVTLRSGCRAVT